MLIGLILLVATLLTILATGVFVGSEPSPVDSGNLQRIVINGTLLHVEVAATPEARIQGLSNRTRLSENRGMLFVFDTPGTYSIWMRDMNFPLDIFWIDENGIIVDAWKNADPDSYPQVFEPRSDALYILEVVAGFSEVYNIEIGDVITGL